MTAALVIFGVAWLLGTGFLAFAALVAGGYTVPFASTALIIPYVFLAATWRKQRNTVSATLLGVTVAAMLACSIALFLWERGVG